MSLGWSIFKLRINKYICWVPAITLIIIELQHNHMCKLPPSQNTWRFWLLDILFDCSSYSKILYKYYLFCYDLFIIRDTLIMTYLFHYLQKKQNKTNGQTWYLKVKSVIYFGTEGVLIITRFHWLIFLTFCIFSGFIMTIK